MKFARPFTGIFERVRSNGWQPIETAPLDKSVLLWWIGIKGATGPASATIGQVSSYEDGSVWDGQGYRPIEWYTHWMPLPPAPTAGQE